MIKFHYIVPFICSLLLTACAEELERPYMPDGNMTAAIEVSLGEMGLTHLQSRAVSEDDNRCLSVVNDLHFNITLKNGGHIFFSLSSGQEPEDLPKGVEIITPVPNGEGAGEKAYIHFNDLEADDIEKVEVIGNSSSDPSLAEIELSTEKGWDKALKTKIAPSATIDADSICPLYGMSEKASSNADHGHNCSLFEVELKRPYAMVKVHVNVKDVGKGFSALSDVKIEPEAVQIINVPKSCNLTGNNYANSIDEMNLTGLQGVPFVKNEKDSSIYEMQVSRMYTLENCANNKAVANTIRPADSDYENFPEWKKNPNDTGDAYEAFTAKSNAQNRGNYCSYILVKAKYSCRSAEGKSHSGTISYRLFLGEDIKYGFNVKRNNIYDVTLNLTGDGGLGEGGIKNGDVENPSPDGFKWRVDAKFPKVLMNPAMSDINATTEIVEFKLTDVGNKIANDKDRTYYLVLYDMTTEKHPSILCFYNSKTPFQYPSRYADTRRPSIWSKNTWNDFGSNFSLGVETASETTTDADSNNVYHYKIIFPTITEWEMYLNCVDYPYREYRLAIIAMNGSMGPNSSYWGDFENYRLEPKHIDGYNTISDTHVSLNEYLENRNGEVIAYSTVRQWTPIKIYDKKNFDNKKDEPVYCLDRVDRFESGIPFGYDNEIGEESINLSSVGQLSLSKDNANGFYSSLGLFKKKPNVALQEIGEDSNMKYYFEKDLKKLKASSYGLFTGLRGLSLRSNGADYIWTARLFPLGGNIWNKDWETARPNVDSKGLMCWSLPSKDEWDLFLKGHYDSRLNSMMSIGNMLVSPCRPSGEYWTANYEDSQTAVAVSIDGKTFNSKTLRDSRIGVRLRYRPVDIINGKLRSCVMLYDGNMNFSDPYGLYRYYFPQDPEYEDFESREIPSQLIKTDGTDRFDFTPLKDSAIK